MQKHALKNKKLSYCTDIDNILYITFTLPKWKIFVSYDKLLLNLKQLSFLSTFCIIYSRKMVNKIHNILYVKN